MKKFLLALTCLVLSGCVYDNPYIKTVDPTNPDFVRALGGDENFPEVFHCSMLNDPDFDLFYYEDYRYVEDNDHKMQLHEKARYAQYVVTERGEIRKVLTSYELARIAEEYEITDHYADDPISQQGNHILSLCH